MMKLFKIKEYSIVVVMLSWVIFFVGGCSKEESKEKVISSQKDKSRALPERSEVRFRPPAEKLQKSPKESPSSVSNDVILGEVSDIVGRLRKGGAPINVIADGWKSFDHKSFKVAVSADDVTVALNGGGGLTLVDEIRDPSSKWNADTQLKRAVVGRLSLLTGLIGASGESTTQLPKLFSAAAKQPNPTYGDLLTLRMVSQASKVSDRRVRLNQIDVPAWVDFAASPNPVYRSMALSLFNLLETEPDQATEFYSVYLNEQEPDVAKLYIEQVASSKIPDALSLLEQFKSSPAAKLVEALVDEKIEQIRANRN